MSGPFIFALISILNAQASGQSDLNSISEILNVKTDSNSEQSLSEAKPISEDSGGSLENPFSQKRIPEEERLYPPGYKRRVPYSGPLKEDEQFESVK